MKRWRLPIASVVLLVAVGGVTVAAQSDEQECRATRSGDVITVDLSTCEVPPSTTEPPATTEQPATTTEAPATTSSTAPATTSPTSSPPSTQPDPWEARSVCLTGADWASPMRRLNASPELYGGGLLIWQRAWDLYGGTAFASSPAEASRAEQIAVAERIAADVGPSPDWDAC